MNLPSSHLADRAPDFARAHPLLRCIGIYRRIPGLFSLALGLFVVVNASLALQQVLIGSAVDALAHRTLARLWQLAAIIVAVALVRAAVQAVASVVSLIAGQALLFVLRESILVRIQSLDLGYHARHGTGEMVTRTTRDADKVRDALISVWRNVIETALVIAASLGVLAWYAPSLAVVPALLIAVGVALFVRYADGLVALDRAVSEAYDVVNQDLIEGVAGVRVIKSFGLEQERIDRFDRNVLTFTDRAEAALRHAALRMPVPQILVALGHVWVFAWGLHLVRDGRIAVGALVASLLAMNTLIFRFEGIGRVVQTFADARSSAARILELLDAEPSIVSGERPLSEDAALGIELHDVHVDGALAGVSLRVAPGEIVGVVGATGSGKSTLVQLLPRLLDPTRGRVTIGGVDARELDLVELRRRVHVSTQDCFLFSDTVEANVRVASPRASAEELADALRAACADDVVASLPEGLSTVIGDRGVTLSGGQRQRIALARALLSRPAVLALDDTTSALDAITEQRVLRALRRRDGLTTILVASKPSTLAIVDRVIVLAEGRIVAEGTHETLAASSRAYRELMGIEDAA